MVATLPLLAALVLTPAQPAGGLKLTNVRNTFGELGGVRPDSRMFPGDVLFVGFDIEGLKVAPDGKVVYTMALEVQDATGKAIFKQDPAEKADFVPLGGSKLPGRAFITVGLDQPPGKYTLKLTVTDPATKAADTLVRPFEVLAKDFGIVAVYTSMDEGGRIPAPTTGVVGQSLYLQFLVVGFQRSADKKQPDVQVEMAPLDETGKPTLDKPASFDLKGGVDEKDPGFTLRYLLPLTRAGKFTVRLKATDNLTKKTATFDLPVAVVPSAN